MSRFVSQWSLFKWNQIVYFRQHGPYKKSKILREYRDRQKYKHIHTIKKKNCLYYDPAAYHVGVIVVIVADNKTSRVCFVQRSFTLITEVYDDMTSGGPTRSKWRNRSSL